MFVDNNPVQAALSLGGGRGGRETVFVDTNPVQAALSLGGGRERGGDSVC